MMKIKIESEKSGCMLNTKMNQIMPARMLSALKVHCEEIKHEECTGEVASF